MQRERRQLSIVTAILICLGIIMIYSSSSCYAYERFTDSAFYLKKHLIHTFIGVLFGIFFAAVDYRKIKRYAKPLILFSLLSLILVLIPGIGHESGGAKRWIRLGFFGFQPSELAGLFLIIYLSDLLERKQMHIRDFIHGFLPPLIVSGVMVLLILLQPDLGSAVTLFTVSFVMIFASGANMMHILPLLLFFAPTLYLLILKVPYRLRRIIGYLDPWKDAQGAGFQVVQSFLALGSGGVFGLGLGCSRQKLFYLPQAHTDFIFSIIGEELGLIGTIGVIVLFSLFIFYGLKIAIMARDLFGKFLALGITVNIGIRALVNIAVSTGTIPTKGLPLPFISYGGTSLVFNIISVAILLNIARVKEVKI